MEKNNKVIIAYATNDGYASYMAVSVYSLIQHTSKNNYYKIHILQENLNESYKEKIMKLQKENIEIEFVDISERMEGKEIPQVGHLSKETTYRLLSDKIFEKYEKVLYIDCDTIINKDVALLYNNDIEGFILGASMGSLHNEMIPYICEELNIPSSGYFNAGILLINVKLFGEYSIGDKCFELLQSERVYKTMDQDVLNITCQGKVNFFDGRWNVEWGNLAFKRMLSDDEVKKGKAEHLKDPYIIHYTTSCKPWAHPEIKMAEYFWKYARETEFYEEILFSNMKTKEPQRQFDFFRRFVFPWEAIKPKDAIVIYGAGVVGKIFIEQIEMSQYCNIIAVCDRKHDEIKNMIVPLVSIEEIVDLKYDKIIIAIERKGIAMEIMHELENKGIEKDKIFWRDYKRK